MVGIQNKELKPINFAYKVVMNMFIASSTIIEKNLSETEATLLAKKLNSNCDIYTDYSVEKYIIPIDEFRDSQLNKIL